MKKILVIILISSMLLSGCTLNKSGNDLTGFILKINERNESYNLSSEGFIYNSDDNTLSKFLLIGEYNILLSFNFDNKGRLIKMDITTEQNAVLYDSVTEFLEDAIYVFIDDESIAEAVLSDISFFDAIKNETKNTIKTENGNISLLLDVTEYGTVITVYKDI